MDWTQVDWTLVFTILGLMIPLHGVTVLVLSSRQNTALLLQSNRQDAFEARIGDRFDGLTRDHATLVDRLARVETMLDERLPPPPR